MAISLVALLFDFRPELTQVVEPKSNGVNRFLRADFLP